METKDENNFELPTFNSDDEKLRKRTNKNGKEETGKTDPNPKPKLGVFESAKNKLHENAAKIVPWMQNRYASIKTKSKRAISYADTWWLSMQKRHAWLKGDEYSDPKYNSRVPLKLYPVLDYWQRNNLALKLTLCGTICLLILWSLFSHAVETSVKLHLLDSETNDDVRILDLTLTDVYYPTKDPVFDEWIIEASFPEFSALEFAAQSIVSTVFIHASVLFHNNEKSLYSITMDDMHSIFAQRCNDPNSCGCMSLLQMGIPRNAIYIYDVSIKHYVLLFDPKIKGNDKTNFHSVPWTLDDTLPHQKQQTVSIDVPTHVLVTFKDKHQNGKTNTRQFSNEVAACLYLQLQLKSNYTQLRKTIKDQLL
jgi:hypothetical protein